MAKMTGKSEVMPGTDSQRRWQKSACGKSAGIGTGKRPWRREFPGTHLIVELSRYPDISVLIPLYLCSRV
jgi:hypothetical protein